MPNYYSVRKDDLRLYNVLMALITDGAGLFCGVLQHLLNRGNDCPRVLAATHFHDLFSTAQIDSSSLDRLTCLHMEVIFTRVEADNNMTDEQDMSMAIGPGEKITYLYRCVLLDHLTTVLMFRHARRVASGLALDSHAAQCAELFGLPPRIVERAVYVR